jgi:Ca2+-binding RTX toxin-like protein
MRERGLGAGVSVVVIGLSVAGGGCSVGEEAARDDRVTVAVGALTGSASDPVAFCRASGLNVIVGDASNNVITGTPGSDCIAGLGGQDVINGNGGGDIIFGGDGDDVINGGGDDDQIFGGSGQDTIHGNGGNDRIFGEDGDDVLFGEVGDDTIAGGAGQDRISGGGGNDTLAGGAGDDNLDGAGGDDQLSDCAGHNVLRGGAGVNTCQASTTGASSSNLTDCQVVVACNAANEWPQFQHDAVHSGDNLAEQAFSTATLETPLQIAFKAHFGTNAAGEAGAVEADGLLYVADSGSEASEFLGSLSVFDAAGCGGPVGGSCEPIWRATPGGGGITTTPAVSNGFVMIASRAAGGDNPPFLFGYAARGCGASTCRPVWRGVLQDAVVDSSPAVANGIAYIGDFSGRFYAFDVAACGAARNLNCRPIWTGQAGPQEELTTAPVVGPHFVVISSFLADPNFFGGRVNAFRIGGCGNPANVPCAPVWTADLGSPGTGQTIAGSTVFVGSGAGAFAFSEAGCGGAVCSPLRTYDTGEPEFGGGALGAPVVVGGTLLVSSQNTPDPSTVGVVAAYSAGGTTGCVRGTCEPIWIGVNFASGFESSPAVAGDVVFVGKAPASGFPVDAGVFAYSLHGCGAGQTLCLPLSLTQVGTNQFSLGAPLAIARDAVYFVSNDNDDQHSNVYALTVP